MSAARRFRKKPVEIEAMQWDGTFDGYLAVAEWCGNSVEWRPTRTHDTSTRPDGTEATFERAEPVPQHVRLFVAANDAWLRLEPHEWILQDTRGFYPCKPDIFAATYEAAGVEMVEALTYADATQKLTAALRVRVIPEGEPFDGPVIGAVALTTPPEDVESVATAVRKALGGKVGFEQLPESILPARTVALVDAVVRSRRPLHDGRFVFDPTSNPDLVVVTVELSAVLDHRLVRQIETEGHG